MLETLFVRSYILSHMFRDKTIFFFSCTPLLRTLKLKDTKSPPPPFPRGGVRNNGSRLYTYNSIWISTRRWKDRLHLLEALIFTKKLLQKLSIEIKNHPSARDTQSLLRDNIVLKCAKDILPYIHVTLPAMSTEIDLVVVSTCSIRLLISTRVSGFPSTNSFLRSGSFLTTSSTFSWLFLKSSS